MPRKHPLETRAAAMAELLTGASVASVARSYKIPKQTISDWKRRALNEFIPDLKKELNIHPIKTGPFDFSKRRPG